MVTKEKQLVSAEPINKKWHQMPEKNQERKGENICQENGILQSVSLGMLPYTLFSKQLIITLKSTSRVVMFGIYIKQINLGNIYTN
jgi:hypothetical protein